VRQRARRVPPRFRGGEPPRRDKARHFHTDKPPPAQAGWLYGPAAISKPLPFCYANHIAAPASALFPPAMALPFESGCPARAVKRHGSLASPFYHGTTGFGDTRDECRLVQAPAAKRQDAMRGQQAEKRRKSPNGPMILPKRAVRGRPPRDAVLDIVFLRRVPCMYQHWRHFHGTPLPASPCRPVPFSRMHVQKSISKRIPCPCCLIGILSRKPLHFLTFYGQGFVPGPDTQKREKYIYVFSR